MMDNQPETASSMRGRSRNTDS